MLLITVVTLTVTVVACVILGRYATRRAMRSTVIDGMDMLGQHKIAEELRSMQPVVPYYIQGALVCVIAGLLLGGVLPMLLIYWNDMDFYTHRMAAFHLTYGSALLGGLVGAIAGRIIIRQS